MNGAGGGESHPASLYLVLCAAIGDTLATTSLVRLFFPCGVKGIYWHSRPRAGSASTYSGIGLVTTLRASLHDLQAPHREGSVPTAMLKKKKKKLYNALRVSDCKTTHMTIGKHYDSFGLAVRKT